MRDKIVIKFKKDGGISIDTTIHESKRAEKLMECYAALTAMIASEIGSSNEALLHDFLNMAKEAGLSAAKEQENNLSPKESEETNAEIERDSK